MSYRITQQSILTTLFTHRRLVAAFGLWDSDQIARAILLALQPE